MPVNTRQRAFRRRRLFAQEGFPTPTDGAPLIRPMTSVWWDGQGRLSTANERVTEPQANGVAAYFAAIRNISEDIGKLPLNLFRRDGKSKTLAEDHPLFKILHSRPNGDMNSMTWREVSTQHALGWGNAFSFIEREGGNVGTIESLYPIHPSLVQVKKGDNGLEYHIFPVGYWSGAASNVEPFILPASEVFHLRGMGPDGLVGYSALVYGAEVLGVSIAAQKQAGAFFGNGAMPAGVLTHPETIGKPEVRERIREQWNDMHKGAGKSGKTAVLEEGMSFLPIQFNAEEAQIVQSRQFQVTEIARMFRIPPHKIGQLDEASLSNIEQQNIEYVGDTLGPWDARWTQEINFKLLDDEFPEIFAKFDISGLIVGSIKDRSDARRTEFTNGAISINEWREQINLNPIGEEGDVHFIQGAMITVEAAIENSEPESNPQVNNGNASGENTDQDQAEEMDAEEQFRRDAELIRPALQAAIERVCAKEQKARERKFKPDKEREHDQLEFAEWADGFYPGVNGYFDTEIAAVFAGISKKYKLERLPSPDGFRFAYSDLKSWHFPDQNKWFLCDGADALINDIAKALENGNQ